MLGSAVGGVVIFVVSVYGYFWYQFARVGPGAEISLPTRSEKVVTAAPPIVDVERFHGSTGVFMGEFPVDGRHAVLAAGPARLVGTVTSSGKPVEGLRVRLALNGAVMSQWATSGADGKYQVALPAGTYRIDGYELDSQSAHRVLRGKKEVSEGWKPFYEGPQAPFAWEPERVEVIDSGTLALSTGPVTDQGKRVGTFTSTWRREKDGRWRIVLDSGCPPCRCP